MFSEYSTNRPPFVLFLKPLLYCLFQIRYHGRQTRTYITTHMIYEMSLLFQMKLKIFKQISEQKFVSLSCKSLKLYIRKLYIATVWFAQK